MGNVCIEKEPETCIICYDEFDDQIHSVCLTCNVYIHRKCLCELLKMDKSHLCPHCRSIGSLMSSYVPTTYGKTFC